MLKCLNGSEYPVLSTKVPFKEVSVGTFISWKEGSFVFIRTSRDEIKSVLGKRYRNIQQGPGRFPATTYNFGSALLSGAPCLSDALMDLNTQY